MGSLSYQTDFTHKTTTAKALGFVGRNPASWGYIREELVYSRTPTEALGFAGPHSFADCAGDDCVCVLLQVCVFVCERKKDIRDRESACVSMIYDANAHYVGVGHKSLTFVGVPSARDRPQARRERHTPSRACGALWHAGCHFHHHHLASSGYTLPVAS